MLLVETEEGFRRWVPESTRVGDALPIVKGEPTEPILWTIPESIEEIEALLMGLIAGDGWLEAPRCAGAVGSAGILLVGEDQTKLADVENLLTRVFSHHIEKQTQNGKTYKPYGTSHYPAKDKVVVRSAFLARVLRDKYGFTHDTKHVVPELVMSNARTYGRWYLAGLFFADGTVTRNNRETACRVVLSQSDKELLQQVQEMLLLNGVYSRIRLNRKEGFRTFMGKEYQAKAQYELAMASDRSIFSGIGFWNSRKDVKLASFGPGRIIKNPTATVQSIVRTFNNPTANAN
jgi:intein/homing endonuclease